MKYECFISPGHSGADIEAECAEEARRLFCEMVCENLSPEDIVANCLDTEDGEDPKKGA